MLTALGAVTLAGCLSIPEGVGADKLGAIEVSVVDQNNAPVVTPSVTVQQYADGRLVQIYARETNVDGQVRFDAVQQATVQVWALAPGGYTGGGEQNAKTVDVREGQVAIVKITLTKTTPLNH
jgi:hypothetical protein